MLNVVYLVLVMHYIDGNSQSMTNVIIPQANMAQCEVNKKHYEKSYYTAKTYCIAGVMPK